jgi:hypothetical protein
MIPALLGIIAPSFAPVTMAVTSSQAVAVPGGATTVDIYIVQPGVGGGTNGGDGGNGGDCNWDVALAVAGHSSLYLNFLTLTAALWGVNSSGTSISLRFSIPGGVGGSSGGTGFGGGGGGAATELGAGGVGGSGGFLAGGTSVTAGSVLASYVGHGGDGGAQGQAGSAGVGWGAGGGGSGAGSGAFGGQGGLSGVLLIFK